MYLINGADLCFCSYTEQVCFVRRPNVCPYQDVETRLVQVPCRQAFTRIAKVWKPDCGKSGHWCIGHERRYTTERVSIGNQTNILSL